MIATSLRARIGSLRSESGIALPVSITVLMITGALAAAAATSAMTANHQSSRDKFVKRAVAAADAGIEIGKFRINKFATVLTATNQCVSKNTTTGVLYVETVQADGWCRQQTEDLGDGVSYSYRVSGRTTSVVGGQDVNERRIVATGLVGGLQRRAATTVATPSAQPLFFDGVFSDQDLDIANSAQITGNVRSNGNVNVSNSAKICGNVQPGPGKTLNGSKNCSTGTVAPAAQPFVFAPVVTPTSNENYRITPGTPGPDDPRVGTVGWSESNRQLTMDHNDLTLNGSVYVFCKLTMGTSTRLIIPDDGTPVKIYFDSPDNCGGAGTGSFSISTSSSEIDNPSGDPSMLQFYFAGSKTTPSTAVFDNQHSVAMTVYAPDTNVLLSNSTSLVGGIIAKKVSMQNSASVTWDSRAGTFSVGTTPLLQIYKRQSWTECTATASGSSPDSGC